VDLSISVICNLICCNIYCYLMLLDIDDLFWFKSFEMVDLLVWVYEMIILIK